mgnify:CR=1 FL=1
MRCCCLAIKEKPTQAEEAKLSKLKEYSVVNDKIYAQAYINSNSNFSKNKVKQKLMQAGVKNEN